MSKLSFSIQTAARISGVGAHAIRAWERRNRAITPDRTATGRRAFSLENIERLKLLRRVTLAGHPIGDIAGLDDAALGALLLEPISPFDVSSIEERVLDFKLRELDLLLGRYRGRLSMEKFIFQVVTPTQVAIGRAVREGRLGIAHEHAVSVLLRDQLTVAIRELRPSRGISSRLTLVTTCEGDLHEMGALSAAALCAARGCDVRYLGPNLPAEDAAFTVERMNASLLVIGTTALPKKMQVQPPEQYIEQVAHKIQSSCTILTGGNGLPAVWEAPTGVHRFESLQDLSAYLGSDS